MEGLELLKDFYLIFVNQLKCKYAHKVVILIYFTVIYC